MRVQVKGEEKESTSDAAGGPTTFMGNKAMTEDDSRAQINPETPEGLEDKHVPDISIYDFTISTTHGQ